jgi:hypothetical protein
MLADLDLLLIAVFCTADRARPVSSSRSRRSRAAAVALAGLALVTGALRRLAEAPAAALLCLPWLLRRVARQD